MNQQDSKNKTIKNTLGRITILVKDTWLNYRSWREISPYRATDLSDSFGIWLLKSDNNKHVGNQTNGQPTMVIYTSDLSEIYEKLRNNNVKIKVEPVSTPDYKYLHCLNLYGNEIVVVEL